MAKPIVRMEKWFRIANKLYGTIYDHPNFDDGTEVRTSSIQDEYLEGKQLFIETKNTIYKMGSKRVATREEKKRA